MSETTGDDSQDTIQAFLKTFREGDARLMAAHLDRSVNWTVAGTPALAGREALKAFWSRLLNHYQGVRIELRRLVVDGDTRIADQLHVYSRSQGAPIVLENIAVYEVRDGRIVSWSDNLDLTNAPEDEKAVWRKFRDVAKAY